MSELISLIVFLIVDVFAAHSFPQYYGTIMNTTSSVCIIYVLFLRTYLLLIRDKTIPTNKKNFIMASTYAIMTFNAVIAIMFYYINITPNIRLFTQVFTYGAAMLMLGFIKYKEFKEYKLYGKIYTILTCIDILFIILYLIIDFMITPKDFVTNHDRALFSLCLLFIPIMINNCIISYFKDYWLHKKVLISKLTTKVKCNKEKNLLIEGRNMHNSQTLREVAYVLDNAPVRPIEVAHIIKTTHDIMIANGRTTEEAIEFSSKFGGIIYLQFMKRKYDFSMLFRPIVKLLQTYSKHNNNNRNLKLSI